MSQKWPRVPPSRLVRLLERLGYERVHQRGSHLKMRKVIEGRPHTIVLVVHAGRDAPPGHIASVLKDVARRNNLSVEKLLEEL